MNREALTLAANGIATVEDIDRAWMAITKMPIGLFGVLDMVGLDTPWDISDYWQKGHSSCLSFVERIPPQELH